MKAGIRFIPLSLLLVLLVWGCSAKKSSGDDCTEGASQCDGDTVQHCVGSEWVDWTDCDLLGGVCGMIGGEAECIGASDTGTDGDVAEDTPDDGAPDVATDTETDSPTDTVSDAPVSCPIHVNMTGSDDATGHSWGEAKSTIQAAITTASESGLSVCEVWVAQGIYFPTVENMGSGERNKTFILSGNAPLRGGFAGTETSADERVLGTAETVLSGDLDGGGTPSDDDCYHVVFAPAATFIEGFTITGGNANGGSGDHYHGGGIRSDWGGVTVENVLFKGNHADMGGAGMYVSEGMALSELTGCVFEDNHVTGTSSNDGAGILSHGGILVLEDVDFIGNTGGFGPGISMSSGALTMTDCDFTANRGTGQGGAVYLNGSGATIDGGTFEANVSEGAGGAIYHQGSGLIEITNAIFRSNASFQGGGALYFSEGAPAISSCLFEGNVSEYEGGAVQIVSSTDPTFDNCTFVANGATSQGGAIAVSSGCTSTITNSLFWGNTAGFGNDTIHNEPGTPDATSAMDYCVVQGGCATIIGATCGSINFAADPLLGDLPLMTRMVSAESGATDTVIVTTAMAPEFAVGEKIEIGDDGTVHTISSVSPASGSQNLTFSPALPAIAPIGTRIDKWGAAITDPTVDAHVQNHSSCIDAGNDDRAPATDLDGVSRSDNPDVDNCPIAGEPECSWISDIGAYEYI